jgi:hypothetical protein
MSKFMFNLYIGTDSNKENVILDNKLIVLHYFSGFYKCMQLKLVWPAQLPVMIDCKFKV